MALATATAGTLSGQEKLIASKDKTTLSWLGEKVVGQHSGTIDIKSGHLTWLGNKIASGEFVIANKASSFSVMLENAVNDVNRLQKEADESIQKLAAGEGKDIHQTMIDLEKAEISFQLMMQVRNKIIAAYEEVMRMQI